MTPEPDADALVALREASEAIVVGVEATLPGWVVACVTRILDAWGRADDATRDAALERAHLDGPVAARRIGAELRALFALDPADQRATPLEVVRGAVRTPTEILIAADIPPIERDAFDERSWPEDRYGLVPATLGDLGDPDLGPLLLAWGLAKTKVLRARATG